MTAQEHHAAQADGKPPTAMPATIAIPKTLFPFSAYHTMACIVSSPVTYTMKKATSIGLAIHDKLIGKSLLSEVTPIKSAEA
ncbi:hypothetical protein SCUCBS95973_003950 [Sporothrix curviconia]|uniref:Uncharacterized protein n=1 Tax=Sporothrix curviconia TaxID=1260050 RepID=A0ABP0BJL5_9PEZI